ncbi:hypothetical protein STEG23_030070 [Scotinomys teguina]
MALLAFARGKKYKRNRTRVLEGQTVVRFHTIAAHQSRFWNEAKSPLLSDFLIARHESKSSVLTNKHIGITSIRFESQSLTCETPAFRLSQAELEEVVGKQTAHGLAGFPKQWLPTVRMCHPSAKEPDAPCQNAVSRLEAELAKSAVYKHTHGSSIVKPGTRKGEEK